MKKLLTLFLIVLLTGCGFQLRGSFELPADLKTLKVEPNDPYNPLQKRLRRLLLAQGIELSDAKTSPGLLSITQESFTEEVTSYGLDGQANRSTLRLIVHYTLQKVKHSVEQVVQVQRDLIINPNRPLDTEAERERLKDDLYTDAAHQLIRQLSLIK